MRVISLYLFKSVLAAILVSLLAILGIDFIFTFLNELRFVGKGDYSLLNAMVYLLLTLPRHIVEMFPFAALLGTVMGLSILAQHSELLVLQSMGVSSRRIALNVVKSVAVLVIVVALISEFVAPKLEQLADAERATRLSSGQMVKSLAGTWLRDGKTFIHVHEWESPHKALGVTRYEFNDAQELIRASFSARAAIEQNKWTLYDTRETQFSANATKATKIKEMIWENHLRKDVMNLMTEDHVERLPARVLRELIVYRSMNQLETKPLELAFYQRLIQPIAILLMLMLAIPFVFGPQRSTTRGFRLMIGLGLGFVFYLINGIMPQLSFMLTMPAWLSALIPSLLIVVALYIRQLKGRVVRTPIPCIR